MGLAQDLQKAALDHRKQRSEVAPGLQTVLTYAQASAKERGLKGGDAAVNDEDALRAIQRGIKMCKDTLGVIADRGIQPTNDKVQRELEVLEALLPEMASEEEVRAAAQAFVSQNELDAKKGMGQVMAHLSQKFGTSLDKSQASRIAKEALVQA